MSQRRLSKRSYAIKNRRLLEEKLFARSLKSKKKAKNTDLLAASDALSESDGASAFGPTSNSSVGGSPISLEWDSSGQSPPLFENLGSSSPFGRHHSTTDELVDGIVNLDCENEIESSNRTARGNLNSSTDFLFIDREQLHSELLPSIEVEVSEHNNSFDQHPIF